MDNMLNSVNFDDFLKLTNKQQEYIRIKAETNKMDKEISKIINIRQQSISRWKKDRKFTQGQQGYQLHHLYNHVPAAMKRMIELLGARSELVSYQAAKDILDRTGYNPVERQEIEHSGGVTFNDDIK